MLLKQWRIGAAVALSLLSGCGAPPVAKVEPGSSPVPYPTPAPVASSREIPDPAENTLLLGQVIGLQRPLEATDRTDAIRVAFVTLKSQAQAALVGTKTPAEKIAALNAVVLQDRTVKLVTDQNSVQGTLGATLLTHQGNSMAAATLYVLVSRELGMPIHLVLWPGDALARWDDGATQINIDMWSSGRSFNDAYYQTFTDAMPTDIERMGWGKSLTDAEFLGEEFALAARVLYENRKVSDAIECMTRAEDLTRNRPDHMLESLIYSADLKGQRQEVRKKVEAFLGDQHQLAPTVTTNAYLFLADDAAGRSDHKAEHVLLQKALIHAPKARQYEVLVQQAFCLRALHDYHGALRTMELASAWVDPDGPYGPDMLYTLAILQHDDKDSVAALKSVRAALDREPDCWYMDIFRAGMLAVNGDVEKAKREFDLIEPPGGNQAFHHCMVAWFNAVTGQREPFYVQFELALKTATSTRVLQWIDQDPDLNVYRDEPEFKALVSKYAPGLLGQ